MSARCPEVQELLPLYAAGTLDGERRGAIAEHLGSCPECRAELALWAAIGDQVVAEDRRLPAPSAAVLSGALAQVRAGRARPPALARLSQLLRAQMPLLRREIWIASAFVMAVGCLLGLNGPAGGASILTVVAPLVAAAGVAMIYGPENDPALELALATPTSPRQVLLARLVLVFGYDLALALGASVLLVAVGEPTYGLAELVLSWLAPMTSLSALALALSLWIGAGNAASVAFLMWALRWQLPGWVKGGGAWTDTPILTGIVAAIEGVAASQRLQFGLARLLLALAMWLVNRPRVPAPAT